MMRVLISRRVKDWLSGTGAGQAAGRGYIPEGDTVESVALLEKILLPIPTRKDRATWVELTPAEAEHLTIYLGAMEAGGRDNSWDADGRADLAAATALLRKIA